MKTRLEDEMKGMMDGASLSELLPDFNKDAFWADIAPTLPSAVKPGRIIAFNFKWAARIAAVLLIAAGAYLAIRATGSTDVAQPQITALPETGARPVTLPAASAVNAVAPAPPARAGSHLAFQKRTALKSIRPQDPITAQPQTAQSSEAQPAVQVAQQHPMIGDAFASKKVKHYLDIDEEAAATPPKTQMAGPSLIQMKLNKPGYEGDMTDRRPLKDLALALSK